MWEVPAPVAGPGQVVVDIALVGVCGTDVEFFTGDMAYLHQGYARYPMRLGHEWCGVVSAAGTGVDEAWLGRRVTGDTMIGCGYCGRCRSGRHNVCAERFEIGIRGGFPGALAEQLAVPVTALVALPDTAVAGRALGQVQQDLADGVVVALDGRLQEPLVAAEHIADPLLTALGECVDAGAAYARVGAGVGMQREEQVGAGLPGDLHPLLQRHVDVGLARHHHLVATGALQARLQPPEPRRG